MSTPKVIADARRALRESKAELAEVTAALEEHNKHVPKTHQPASKLTTTAWQRGDGSILISALEFIGVGWYNGSPKTIRKDLTEGKAKINPHINGIAETSPRSMSKRMVVLTTADRRKRNSLLARIEKLRNELAEHELRAWAHGTVYTPEQWIDYVTRNYAVRERGYRWNSTRHELEYKRDRAQGQVEMRTTHLAWAEGDRSEPCKCSRCDIERQMIENKRRQAEHLAEQKRKDREWNALWRKSPWLRRGATAFVCPMYHHNDDPPKELKVNLENGQGLCQKHGEVGKAPEELVEKFRARRKAA